MAVTDHIPSNVRHAHDLESWTSVSHGPLGVSCHLLGARVACLVVGGELDTGTAAVLERAVLAAWADGAELILVDVRALEFVDVAGLRLLEHLAEVGAVPTVLVEPGPAVEELRRLLARIRHPANSRPPAGRAQAS